MTNEVSTFDPDALKKRVSASIQQQFASLIPPEMWDKMVKDNYDKFMRDEFPALVKQLWREEMTIRIKAEFCKQEWQGYWDGQGVKKGSQMVELLIKENSAALMAGLMGSLVQNAVEHIRQLTPGRY